jgi:hypothetical protein
MSGRFTVVPDDLIAEAGLLGMLRYRETAAPWEHCPVVAEHESCTKARVIADPAGRFLRDEEYIPSRLLTEYDQEITSARERCEELIIEIKQALLDLGVPEPDRWLRVTGGHKHYPFYVRYCPQCDAHFYLWDWLLDAP